MLFIINIYLVLFVNMNYYYFVYIIFLPHTEIDRPGGSSYEASAGIFETLEYSRYGWSCLEFILRRVVASYLVSLVF